MQNQIDVSRELGKIESKVENLEKENTALKLDLRNQSTDLDNKIQKLDEKINKKLTEISLSIDELKELVLISKGVKKTLIVAGSLLVGFGGIAKVVFEYFLK